MHIGMLFWKVLVTLNSRLLDLGCANKASIWKEVSHTWYSLLHVALYIFIE